MPVRPWAVATAAAALMVAHTATASATDPVGTDPTPTPTPTTVPPGLPELPDVAGSVIYVVTVTTTVTTTTVTAPITVVAAPITTTVNNATNNTTNNSTSSTTQAPAPAPGAQTERKRGRMEINLRGCQSGAAGDRFARMQTQVRLPRGTQLIVRVNGRQVGVLDLGAGSDATAKPVPLRIRVQRNGMLSIWRPSGRVLTSQGCSAR
ncbi:hypothetical protein OM076_35580 [Solirubrobacter ginsenosidimutans]|uniref:Uncharacterized protein n=1 Tax=Solirubrobacter ginsenosidimutans TaxID=490573 RepID=A0A9X3SA55_9ACTN|nr:hypothetical protein [Solirubrobacter ginsenosidimutans]MDA0165643.1 hypothetical protein [Solirubrobacter ginsenosidimutans]